MKLYEMNKATRMFRRFSTADIKHLMPNAELDTISNTHLRFRDPKYPKVRIDVKVEGDTLLVLVRAPSGSKPLMNVTDKDELFGSEIIRKMSQFVRHEDGSIFDHKFLRGDRKSADYETIFKVEYR